MFPRYWEDGLHPTIPSNTHGIKNNKIFFIIKKQLSNNFFNFNYVIVLINKLNYMYPGRYYYSNALYFPIEPDVSSMSPQCLLNASSMSPHRVSVSIADECECKGTAFNPFLEALKTEILDVTK